MAMFRGAERTDADKPGFEAVLTHGWTMYEHKDGYAYAHTAPGPSLRFRIRYAVGCCLHTSENNGYHDSDFFMIWFDEENDTVRREMYDTTRCGWGPSVDSFVDATPEIREKYKDWERRQAIERHKRHRRDLAKNLMARRIEIHKAAKMNGIAASRLIKLYWKFEKKQNGWELFDRLMNLLTSTRIRSTFKLSLKAQIIKWAQDPAPQYDEPLSRRQLEFV